MNRTRFRIERHYNVGGNANRKLNLNGITFEPSRTWPNQNFHADQDPLYVSDKRVQDTIQDTVQDTSTCLPHAYKFIRSAPSIYIKVH